MKKTIVAAAVVSACFAYAQEGDTAEGEAVAVKPVQMATADLFSTLPFCREVTGEAEVLKPNAKEWAAVEDGRFYPLGASFRTRDGGHAVIAFGKDVSVSVEGESSFGTKVQPLGGRTRTIVLQSGTIEIQLPENFPEGAFFVASPGFTVKNPAGVSKFGYEVKGDGFEATVRCVTGSMEVEGLHYSIPRMRAANEFRIRSSHDNLETLLYGLSGDFVVKLDQGVAVNTEINDDGEKTETVSAQFAEWHLTPETRVQINRAVPAIGERMSVHTMAFDAAGVMQTERSFCEGRADVNSGELVVKDKADGEELAKRAAEATEEVAAEDAEESDGSGGKQQESSDGADS